MKRLTLIVTMVFCMVPMSALKAAAGGGGSNGVPQFATFLDKLATYLVYIGGGVGALAFGVVGVMFMAGSPRAQTGFALTVVGVGVCFCSKAIMS